MQESDQILAIDGKQLDSGMTHQQAIGVLQQTSGEVELIVARGGIPRSRNLSRTTSGASSALSRTPSDVSTVSHTSVTVPVSKPQNNYYYSIDTLIQRLIAFYFKYMLDMTQDLEIVKYLCIQ